MSFSWCPFDFAPALLIALVSPVHNSTNQNALEQMTSFQFCGWIMVFWCCTLYASRFYLCSFWDNFLLIIAVKREYLSYHFLINLVISGIFGGGNQVFSSLCPLFKPSLYFRLVCSTEGDSVWECIGNFDTVCYFVVVFIDCSSAVLWVLTRPYLFSAIYAVFFLLFFIQYLIKFVKKLNILKMHMPLSTVPMRGWSTISYTVY